MANIFWSFRKHVVRGPAGFMAIITLLVLLALFSTLALAGFLLAISFIGVVRLWRGLTRRTAGRRISIPDRRQEMGFSAVVRRSRLPNLTINSMLRLLSSDGIGLSAGPAAGRGVATASRLDAPVVTVTITEVHSAKESKS